MLSKWLSSLKIVFETNVNRWLTINELENISNLGEAINKCFQSKKDVCNAGLHECDGKDTVVSNDKPSQCG